MFKNFVKLLTVTVFSGLMASAIQAEKAVLSTNNAVFATTTKKAQVLKSVQICGALSIVTSLAVLTIRVAILLPYKV